MYIFLCKYDGHRHSNPLMLFPPLEAVGPFKYEDAIAYEETHRYEGCREHSIVPITVVK